MSEQDYFLSGLIHELAIEVRKAMPEQEKKAKEMKTSSTLKSENHQDTRNTWFKATSSFTTT